MMKKRPARIRFPFFIVSLIALSGCGDGQSSSSSNSGTAALHTLGGSLAGLDSGRSVILLDNGGSALTVSANGAFTFPTALASGTNYVISVGTQPSGQTCSVAGGAGTIGSANVTHAVVTCTDQAFALGGTIQGLNRSGLVLANGSDTFTVPANATTFTMPTAVSSGSTYDVTVQTNPTALDCTATNGAGTMGSADVMNVSVSCVSGTESVLYSFAGGTADGARPLGSLIQGSDGNFYGVTGSGGTSGDGVVFKITPAGDETVLHSFTGGTTDGVNPYGRLIQGSDGNFYGMTESGGASSSGIIFKITPTGGETVLHSFAGGATDGANPYGSLIQGSDGNFYGMTLFGGASNYGVIFKITPGGAETVLHFFAAGTTDGANPYGGLIQGSDGNFYGMTDFGGASNSGVFFRITPTGGETVLYSFAGGTTDGAHPMMGSLIQGSDGNFYGMTIAGGASGNGVVLKITPAGGETVLYSFAGGTTDGANPDGSLIQGSDGNFYGMTESGGASNYGVIFNITPAGGETVLYSFAGGTTDGADPYDASLFESSDGSIYGMTIAGGASGNGIVFDFN